MIEKCESADVQDCGFEFGIYGLHGSFPMNAGSDTAAIAVNATWHLLLKSPYRLRKLREELELGLNADEIVNLYDKVCHLPYLRSCVKEGLHLCHRTQ